MEGASGSRGPKKINPKVIRNAQKLFEVLREESISSQDRFQQISELLNGVDVDVNVPDAYDDRNTLLHEAVNYEFADAVKLFLENDAEINIRNAQGETPLHVAVIRGFVNIVQMILEKGADVNIKNLEGKTPLHIATDNSLANIVQQILNNKKDNVVEQKVESNVPKDDVNIQNGKGETPLHMVFSEKSIIKNKFSKLTRQMFLKRKAGVNIQTSDGKTPLDLAKEKKPRNIIAEFESIKNISSQDEANYCQDDKTRRANTHKVEASDEKCAVQPVADVFASSSKTYASSGAKNNMHGTVYQLCLLMIFAIRALVMGYKFRLGTEVYEAGKFDDLVFKYQCPNTDKLKSLFLQAKCKANAEKGIGLYELLEEGNKGPYSLLKYYKSYLKIRNSKGQEADEIDFCICTNTHFNFSEPGVLIGNGKKLSFKIVTDTFGELFKEGICYKLNTDDETLDWLKNDFVEKLEKEIKHGGLKNSNKLNLILSNLQYTHAQQSGTLRTFLKNLVFVVGQTADNELVKTEFKNYSKTHRQDTDFLTDAFYKQIFDWFSKKEGEWLANEKIKETIRTICEKVNTFASLISQVYAEKLLTSPIKFNSKKLKELHNWISVNRIVNLVTPVETKLTLLHVAQVLEHYPSYKAQNSFIFVHFNSLLLRESQERIIQAFESPCNNYLLVIDCLSKKDEVTQRELTTLQDKLWKITANNDKKKLILIAPDNHALTKTFITHSGYSLHIIKNNFQDFTKETQEMLLATQVTFQGQSVELSQVIDKTELKLLEIVPIETLIGDEGLVIGTEISTSTGYNESYYIDRSLRYQTFIKADLFHDKSCKKFEDELATTELEFQHLCAIHPNNNIHLIEKRGDQFIWVRSQGKLSALRPYIDNDNTLACSEEQFVDSLKFQRVVIISDKAGMGKSTVLDHISKKIKTNAHGTLVLRIDLNKHTRVLKMHKQILFNNISAKEFIFKLFMMTTQLERSLLEQNGKAVFMFDGFDEISPDYKEVVLDLIHNLKVATKAQIWITTRPFMQEELENNLQQFAYTLQPFSTTNQEDFLIKYWKHIKDFKDTDETGIRAFALALVEQFSKSISDKEKEFTGIPLQMRMLAECFVEDLDKPVDFKNEFTFVDLYEKFARIKFDVFLGQKCGIEESLVGSKQSQAFNMHMKQHRWYALSVTFPEEKVDILFPNSKKVTGLDEIESDLNKIGIVSITNGVPHFIHRTFAEYIVAVYFRELLERIDSIKPEVLKDFIISDLLISVNYFVIRSFLNGLFSRKLSERAESRRLGKSIHPFSADLIKNKTEMIENIFLQTAEEGNVHIFNYLLECVQEQQDTLTKFLRCTKSITNKTMLHLAADNNDISFIKKFLNWTRENMEHGQEIVKVTLSAVDYVGNTALLIASWQRNVDVVRSLLQWTHDRMDLGQDIVKQMLLSADITGNTALLMASERGSVDIVMTLLQWTRGNMDQGQDIIKQMLLSFDSLQGHKALQAASWPGNNDVVLTLLEWTRYNMNNGQDLVKEMLLSVDNNGLIALLAASRQGNTDVVHTLLQWTLSNMDQGQDIVKRMLLKPDKNGITALLAASGKGNIDVMLKLLQWTNVNMGQCQEVVEQMLLWADTKGVTTFLAASGQKNKNVVQKLLKWTIDNMQQGHEIVRKVLLDTDCNGDTALLSASSLGNNDVVQTLLQWTLENVNQGPGLVKQMLLSVNNKGLTALLAASGHGNNDVMQTLMHWTRDRMAQGQEIIKEMLKSVNKH